MLVPRKIVFFLFLLVGLSLYAQQDYFVSSYVRGNFYNRGRIAAESLRASDDLIFLNVRPHKDGSLSFENPRVFQEKGENKLDGIDLDFEWAETEKEYKDYSLAILKMREVLGDKYLFSVSLHPVSYKISKEAIAAVDFISLQCYGPSPVRFPMEKYASDIQMVLAYGIPKEKLVAGVPFYGVTKNGSKKTEAYFSFVQDGLITTPAQNEATYKGEVYVFDGQDHIRTKTRYAMEQQLKGMMSWDLATDMPLKDSRSLFRTMLEELGR